MQILPKAAKSLFTEVAVFGYQKIPIKMATINRQAAQLAALYDYFIRLNRFKCDLSHKLIN
jgi:hypothetical protein|tara:strand:- start:595 stop:777 length:183 start_codon:yes stop_codon:yes gene_type:complete